MAACAFHWTGGHRTGRLQEPVRCCACEERMPRGTLVNVGDRIHFRHVGGRCDSPDIEAAGRRKGATRTTNATESNGEPTEQSGTRAAATSPTTSTAAVIRAGTTRSVPSRIAATRISL